jgi:hypothetical protein
MQQPLEAMHTSHPIQLQVDKDLAILIRCMALGTLYDFGSVPAAWTVDGLWGCAHMPLTSIMAFRALPRTGCCIDFFGEEG